MKRYTALNRKLDRISKTAMSSYAPSMAFLSNDEDGKYLLVIGFWDGVYLSGDRMPESLKMQFDTKDKALAFMDQYLEDNPPLPSFKCLDSSDWYE